jgi:hypothetical protein
MVLVRGRYPSNDKREVCPTCMREKLDMIKDITSECYGKAYQEGSNK